MTPTRELPFRLLNVFTEGDDPFSGNPLCVFEKGEGLADGCAPGVRGSSLAAQDPMLGEWARGTDVLLCECSLPTGMNVPGHLTPELCGDLAAGHLQVDVAQHAKAVAVPLVDFFEADDGFGHGSFAEG